jgi:ketol-acid reductoisomerase
MQTIQVEVEDSKLETVLTLLENLREGIIKNITIESDEELEAYKKTQRFQEDKASMQKALADIESGKTKTLSQEEYEIRMNNFTSALRQKHAHR